MNERRFGQNDSSTFHTTTRVTSRRKGRRITVGITIKPQIIAEARN